MQYIVKLFENKVSSKGTPYAKVSFESGQEATVFADFPGYPFQIGQTVEGELKESEYKGKKSFILSSPSVRPQRKTDGIKAAVVEKQKSIEKAQERKEDAIKMASTFRDATILTAAWVESKDVDRPPLTDEAIKLKWQEFRRWLDGEYDNEIPF